MARPKKENAKTNTVQVRLSDEDYGILLRISNDRGDNQSDIIRAALRLYGHLTRQKEG